MTALDFALTGALVICGIGWITSAYRAHRQLRTIEVMAPAVVSPCEPIVRALAVLQERYAQLVRESARDKVILEKVMEDRDGWRSVATRGDPNELPS